MNRRKLSIAASILLGFVLPAVLIIQIIWSEIGMPEAKGGYLDLRDWNFSEDGIVPLKGEWDFYQNQLLAPEAFANAKDNQAQGLDNALVVDVPGMWNDYMESTNVLGSYGYGTYRLVIRLDNKTDKIYGIHTGNIRMANRIYMNGREVGTSGLPTESRETSVPYNVPYLGFTSVTGDTVELIVQVANYAYKSGGIIIPIAFGEQTGVLHNREWRVLQDLISAIGLLMPSIYLLLFYRKLRQELSLLYLGLLCIAGCLYVLTHGEKLLADAVPWLSYAMILKIQATSSASIYYFLLLYISSISLIAVSQKLLRVFKILTITLLASTFVLPASLVSAMEFLMVITASSTVLFVFYIMLRNILRSSNHIFFETLSILSILIIIALQSLLLLGILDTLTIISYEMLFFVIIQAMTMSHRFADSYMEVEQLSRRLITLDVLKDEFLANTSHELRTPLHGIINMADSIMEGAAGSITTEQTRHIAMISATGKRLSLLIHDILDFSSLKNGSIQLHFRPVHLPTVADSVIEVVKHTAGSKKISFVQQWPDDMPLLHADEDRLVQVLYNLLGNAVKFTHEGEISISADIVGERAVITVADTGIGIHTERLEEVFHGNYQNAEGYDPAYKGSGFGLGITKRLVELGGGRIWIEPEREVGTAIHFTMPISDVKELPEAPVYRDVNQLVDSSHNEAAAAAEVMADHSDRVNSGTILIVDDDPVNLQVLQNLLSVEHYKVIAVTQGEAAINEIKQNLSIDLVIADWMMPGMTGIELTRMIRERFLMSELPVLLLTSRSYPDDMEKAFQTGINDFLSKPMESKELRARVRTLIQLRKSVQQAVQSEIAFLQAQIKPHFLYNALNTVISICPVNPDKASMLLMELSQYLRGSFDFHNRDRMVSVQKEIELVRSYLMLEQARFEDRLRVVYEVNEEMYTLIPPLSIQPLVENAIRHGIMRKAYGGTVTISVKENDSEIVISVSDNGVGMSEKHAEEVLAGTVEGRKGVGLRNIDQRLIALYGNGLQINSILGEGTTVSFAIARIKIAGLPSAGTRGD